MESWASRVRTDPHSLAGRGPGPLRELLDEVADAFDRRPFPLLVELPSDRPLTVIGDSHGDWPAVASALEFARRAPHPGRFLALGDYIHRATRAQPDPAALPSGSVWNAAFLLAETAHDPDSVVLLRGNHEATRQIPVPAPTLLRELRRAYSRTEALELWARLVGLLERLPLAARTANGVFLVHGGIPPEDRWEPARWRADALPLLEGLLWSDPEFEYEDRAVGRPYGLPELDRFLAHLGCRFMLKGHAPHHSGRAIYGGRLLTVHTSDLFAPFGEGGVLLAQIPAQPRLTEVREILLYERVGNDWKARPIRVVPAPPAASAGPPGAVSVISSHTSSDR